MDPIDYPELEHAPYSPSKFKYLALCPSWQQGDTEEAGEDAARRGTAIHKAFETEDLSHCETDEEKACALKAIQYVRHIKALRLETLVSRGQRNPSNNS